MFSKSNLHYFIIFAVVVGLSLVAQSSQAKKLNDPTRPPGVSLKQNFTSTSKKSVWRLSSTLIAISRKSATINGILVRQGDNVNGARVIDIQAWDVTLKRNDKIFKVYMFNKKVHKKVSK